MIAEKTIYPYMGVGFDKQKTVQINKKKRTFRIVTYQAYNVMGLIGSENNGVAIFDIDNNRVLCDQIGKVLCGFYEVEPRQIKQAEELVAMKSRQFKQFINTNSRSRYHI